MRKDRMEKKALNTVFCKLDRGVKELSSRVELLRDANFALLKERSQICKQNAFMRVMMSRYVEGLEFLKDSLSCASNYLSLFENAVPKKDLEALTDELYESNLSLFVLNGVKKEDVPTLRRVNKQVETALKSVNDQLMSYDDERE